MSDKKETFVEKLEKLIREEYENTGEIVISIFAEPHTMEYQDTSQILSLKFRIERETR